jgi:ethanolamine ammonia-lyase small subunit
MSDAPTVPSGAKAPSLLSNHGGVETPPLQSAEMEKPLGAVTSARLSLGLGAGAVSTREQLRFQMDHALARDAVHAEMDVQMLVRGLGERGLESVVLCSAVTGGRQQFLRRPDLGRVLDAASREALESVAGEKTDVVFVIADGLSALGVERHALAMIDAVVARLDHESWQVGSVCVVTQARVAVGDEIGEVMRAKLVVMLIGERPGLSAADSLGIYLTWEPRVGRTDAERNCISNVRLGGLEYAEAAKRVASYMDGARRLGASGVALKERAQLSLGEAG